MWILALIEILVPHVFILIIACFIPLYIGIDSKLKEKEGTNAAKIAPQQQLLV